MSRMLIIYLIAPLLQLCELYFCTFWVAGVVHFYQSVALETKRNGIVHIDIIHAINMVNFN